jgi:hypothetical protein
MTARTTAPWLLAIAARVSASRSGCRRWTTGAQGWQPTAGGLSLARRNGRWGRFRAIRSDSGTSIWGVPIAAVTPVECVDGCGGLDPLAIVALVVALSGLAMAWREHQVFLKRVRARARLEVTLRVVQPPGVRGGLVEIDGTAGTIVVEVGLKNYGERAAGATVVNVLFPERAELRWCGPRGEEMDPESSRRIPSGETFDVDYEAEPVRAWYLTKESPRVSLRGGHVTWVSFYAVPPEGGEVKMALRATASCDEMPDNQPDARGELDVRVRLRNRPAAA